MNFATTLLDEISIHFVGNKANEGDLIISPGPLRLSDDLNEKLKNFFLLKFNSVFERFRFVHSASSGSNEMLGIVEGLFSGEAEFHHSSELIAKMLYDDSDHPNIKSGELYVCRFKYCTVDAKQVDAIGIFKTESKSGYIEVNRHGNEFNIIYKEGIDLGKFDKGCLIFNSRADEGYLACIVDLRNKGEEANYWKDRFLGLANINDEFHQTGKFMGMAKQFIKECMPEEFEVEKASQIDLLNKSVEYFKNNEKFNKEQFEEEVFSQPEVIESFRKFDSAYREENDLVIDDSFDISQQAVKKQAKIFKSVLKLDKNFHVYIHGDRELIERGEENGKKYYKIYFDEES